MSQTDEQLLVVIGHCRYQSLTANEERACRDVSKLLRKRSSGSGAGGRCVSQAGNPVWDQLLDAVHDAHSGTANEGPVDAGEWSLIQVLFGASVIGFATTGGGYFAYHSAGALMDKLEDDQNDGGPGFSTSQTAWFLTIYSVPAFFI